MRLILSAIICVALLGLVAPAQAAPPADEKDPRMAAALERVGNGTWTKADLDYIKTDESIAAVVPDPTDEGTTGSASGRDMSAANATEAAKRNLGTCGWWYRAWYRKKSLLGFTIYKYFHRVDYCQRTGVKITKWQGRDDYWEDVDPLAYWRERTGNSKSASGSTARSRMQRHIELCVVRYGCYASLYPWVELTLRAKGDESYRGSGG